MHCSYKTNALCNFNVSANRKAMDELTINKTALSNCSVILSAIFSAHGVGLSHVRDEGNGSSLWSKISRAASNVLVRIYMWKLTYCLTRWRWLDNTQRSSAESVSTKHPPEKQKQVGSEQLTRWTDTTLTFTQSITTNKHSNLFFVSRKHLMAWLRVFTVIFDSWTDFLNYFICIVPCRKPK